MTTFAIAGRSVTLLETHFSAQVRKANQSWPRVFYHWGLPCPTPRALLR
jgi:hypothetical protein